MAAVSEVPSSSSSATVVPVRRAEAPVKVEHNDRAASMQAGSAAKAQPTRAFRVHEETKRTVEMVDVGHNAKATYVLGHVVQGGQAPGVAAPVRQTPARAPSVRSDVSGGSSKMAPPSASVRSVQSRQRVVSDVKAAVVAPAAVEANPRVPVAAFNQALRQLNKDLTDAMPPFARNFARVVTGAGVLGSIGGSVAMALAAPAALTGALTGVGLPHGAALAILAVGVGVVGLTLSILAGSILRSLTRRSIKHNPAFASKILVLKQMETTLAHKAKLAPLDNGDHALLLNTRALLRKVDASFSQSLRKQTLNALATPFALFTAPFKALAQAATGSKAAGGQPRIGKKLYGSGFHASLGLTRIPSSDAQRPAADVLQSNAEVWLTALRAKATPVFD